MWRNRDDNSTSCIQLTSEKLLKCMSSIAKPTFHSVSNFDGYERTASVVSTVDSRYLEVEGTL